jgi:asparagine synthase (glutamine-hydrolysing)
LEPGSWIKLNHGKITSEIWYQIPFSSISNSPQFSYQEAQHLLLEKMDEAVRLRLISDVPLGAFLSGGIDSSVIVALASKYTKKLNTFSIGYQDEPLFDETRYAKLVANKYNTNHTVFSLRNRDIFDHLHQVLNYIDEPFADSSALAVYILSEETRKHATVALSGDGADELFGGYMKHFGEWRLRNGGWKSSIVSLLGPLWESLPKSRNSAFGNRIRKLDKFSKGLKLGEKERYWQWCGYADEKYLKELSSFDSDSTELERRKSIHTKWIGKTGTMNDVLRSDMQLVLPGDMLTKVDLMSMANSLEVRTPFLDFNVVDFAFSLPADYKVNGNGRKLIVQDAFRLLLPEELYNRPKQGFEVPLLNWFRKELSGWIFDELLNESFIREQGLFRYSGIQNLQNQLNSTNPGDSVARLWGLIVFQNWYKNYSN